MKRARMFVFCVTAAALGYSTVRPIVAQEPPQAIVAPVGAGAAPRPPLSPNAARYADALRAIQAKSGRAPTLDDFRRTLSDPGCSISRAEYFRLLSAFLDLQHPKLTAEEIHRRRAAARATIASIDVQWERELGAMADESLRAGRFRFAMDSNKLLSAQHTGPRLNDLRDVYLRAFDGQSEIVYRATAGNRGQAIVSSLIQRSYYFDHDNPLCLANMLDKQKWLATGQYEFGSLEDRAAYPLEELTEFHGRKCVVLLDQDVAYFLDPSMNYAYCGLEAGRCDFNEQLGRLVVDDTYRTEVLDDFRECGGGLWLPQKFVDTTYEHGAPVNVSTVRVVSLDVNTPIDPRQFVDVVPAGDEIVNGLTGLIYVVGESRERGRLAPPPAVAAAPVPYATAPAPYVIPQGSYAPAPDLPAAIPYPTAPVPFVPAMNPSATAPVPFVPALNPNATAPMYAASPSPTAPVPYAVPAMPAPAMPATAAPRWLWSPGILLLLVTLVAVIVVFTVYGLSRRGAE